MKLIKLFILFIFSFQGLNIISQGQLFKQEKEIYISFIYEKSYDIDKLSSLISIDAVHQDGTITAYLNEHTYNLFSQLNINYKILDHPSDKLRIEHSKLNIEQRERNDWNFYPDYDSYLLMMYAFQEQHPELCQVFSIGQSLEGREILMARISGNINQQSDKAKVLYTSSMHGNELAGFNLSLRFIDHLLTNYNSEAEITQLVDELDIWINPLANPDGAYAGGNSSVFGARRGNANGVDLNRNFPDPEDGIHPDGRDWQKETELFMKLAKENRFVLSANFHAGAELINYPWDTWQELHVDDEWWYFVGREWADTVHQYAPPEYLDEFNNGVTNGYAWYSISGGRQDYMNYFHQCMEFTMELTNATLLPPEMLDAHWEYNYRSMINYLKQATYGIQGKISDMDTGESIEARIEISGHDEAYSIVSSDKDNGLFYRPIYEGDYNLNVSAQCYENSVINNVHVENYQQTHLDVPMTPKGLFADFNSDHTSIKPGDFLNFKDQSCNHPEQWNWHFEGAVPDMSHEENPSEILYPVSGIYDVSLNVKKGTQNHSITKEKMIIVAPQFPMKDTISTACFAYFTDSGNDDSNYGNLEDAVITFMPEDSTKFISVDFLSFDLEFEGDCKYDWLKVYNGPKEEGHEIGSYCGSNSPGSIQSTHPSGALSFEFHSDQSVNHSGWVALIQCEELTASQEINLGKFNIYPNPCMNHINITGPEEINFIQILDFSGLIIRNIDCNGSSQRISTIDIPAGIYTFQLFTEGGAINKKITILR